MSNLFWTNSWYSRNRVVARLLRVQDYLIHRAGRPCNYDAVALVGAARYAVKYDHGIFYAGGLKKFKRVK